MILKKSFSKSLFEYHSVVMSRKMKTTSSSAGGFYLVG